MAEWWCSVPVMYPDHSILLPPPHPRTKSQPEKGDVIWLILMWFLEFAKWMVLKKWRMDQHCEFVQTDAGHTGTFVSIRLLTRSELEIYFCFWPKSLFNTQSLFSFTVQTSHGPPLTAVSCDPDGSIPWSQRRSIIWYLSEMAPINPGKVGALL